MGGSYSLVAVPGLLMVVACLFTDHRRKGVQASVVVVRGLSSCGSPALEHWLSSCGMTLSCPVAYGINYPNKNSESKHKFYKHIQCICLLNNQNQPSLSVNVSFLVLPNMHILHRVNLY